MDVSRSNKYEGVPAFISDGTEFQDVIIERNFSGGKRPSGELTDAWNRNKNTRIDSCSFYQMDFCSKLQDMWFEDCTFRECDFGKAIYHTAFINCKFINCKFAPQKMYDVNMEKCVIHKSYIRLEATICRFVDVTLWKCRIKELQAVGCVVERLNAISDTHIDIPASQKKEHIEFYDCTMEDNLFEGIPYSIDGYKHKGEEVCGIR